MRVLPVVHEPLGYEFWCWGLLKALGLKLSLSLLSLPQLKVLNLKVFGPTSIHPLEKNFDLDSSNYSIQQQD